MAHALLRGPAKPTPRPRVLVIATADHGEVGTAHGGLRQKNFYEESSASALAYGWQ
jgi:hypothetical protein